MFAYGSRWRCYGNGDAIGRHDSREFRHCVTGLQPASLVRAGRLIALIVDWFWLIIALLLKLRMSYWSQMWRSTHRHDSRQMNSGSVLARRSNMNGRGAGSSRSQPRLEVPGAIGQGSASISTDSPLMASVRQALQNSASSLDADAVSSGGEVWAEGDRSAGIHHDGGRNDWRYWGPWGHACTREGTTGHPE